jgi:hypothetical protein
MRRLRTAVCAFSGALALAALSVPATSAVAEGDDAELYLVTLTGPGTTGMAMPADVISLWMQTAQDEVLGSVDAPEPVYRWTTALSGVAVELTADQATRLAFDSRVALVEKDRLLHLAGTTSSASSASSAPAKTTRGGAGTVIGFVDSGIVPEGAVFAGTPGLGAAPTSFRGECRTAPDWSESSCTPKIVGAQWFVDGFGSERLRDASSLSARDDDGHGTAVASVAAGNDGLTARGRGQRLGTFAGVAPDARIATYKACWTAPDPDDDGCAASDVVSAIDRATADGVDVLNVSVASDGAPDPAEDTVQRALLGAAEADVVVVAAAGNGPGEVGYAAPWVTTVGAVTTDVRRGLVLRRGAGVLRGVMVSDKKVGPARLVLGSDAVAAGSHRSAARLCEPGSLDAATVGGHIVLCARGGVGRTDKSLAVRQADGLGMVLANQVTGSLDPDLHAVPTVHVDAAQGDSLRRWLTRHPNGRVTLVPGGLQQTPPRVAGWSRTGDLGLGVVTPDVLAGGAGVLAAGRPDSSDSRWQLVSGTSVAAAQVSGLAAVIRADRSWSAPLVRSALTGTATPVAGSRTGAGLARRSSRSASLGVTVSTGDYRAWLEGRRTELGTAALLLDRDRRTVTRTVTNLSGTTRTFTARVSGIPGLQVTPRVLRLTPGESADVTLRVTGRLRDVSRGVVTWRDARGVAARWPVVVSR